MRRLIFCRLHIDAANIDVLVLAHDRLGNTHDGGLGGAGQGFPANRLRVTGDDMDLQRSHLVIGAQGLHQMQQAIEASVQCAVNALQFRLGMLASRDLPEMDNVGQNKIRFGQIL